MIKIKGQRANGRTILLIGLSHANLDKLRHDGLKGRIAIDCTDMGIGQLDDIWITAAETEGVLMDAFADMIGPNTKVNIDPKLKS